MRLRNIVIGNRISRPEAERPQTYENTTVVTARGSARSSIVESLNYKKREQTVGRRPAHRDNIGVKPTRRLVVEEDAKGRLIGRRVDAEAAKDVLFGPKVRVSDPTPEASLEEKEKAKIKLNTVIKNPTRGTVQELADEIRKRMDEADSEGKKSNIIMTILLPAIDALQAGNQARLVMNLVSQIDLDVTKESYRQMGIPHTINGKRDWVDYGSRTLLYLSLLQHAADRNNPVSNENMSPVLSVSGNQLAWSSLVNQMTAKNGILSLRDLKMLTTNVKK